jgi:hypothetical protein
MPIEKTPLTLLSMKKLILIAMMIVSWEATAQNEGEGFFFIRDNFIVWTKIYDTIPNIEAISNHPAVEFNSENRGVITRTLPPTINKKRMNEMMASFVILQKDGRYKVEVSNIKIFPPATVQIYGIKSTQDAKALEATALNKRGEFSDNFFPKEAQQSYEKLFSSIFNPKTKEEEVDW